VDNVHSGSGSIAGGVLHDGMLTPEVCSIAFCSTPVDCGFTWGTYVCGKTNLFHLPLSYGLNAGNGSPM
jgi:hypothetical protein